MAHGRDKERSRRNRRRIRDLLMVEWDPIGVEGVDEAQDEYDSYVARLYIMFMDENASADEMAEYLYLIESEHMGLGGMVDRRTVCRRVADKLVEMKSWFEAANDE